MHLLAWFITKCHSVTCVHAQGRYATYNHCPKLRTTPMPVSLNQRSHHAVLARYLIERYTVRCFAAPSLMDALYTFHPTITTMSCILQIYTCTHTVRAYVNALEINI